MTGTRWLAIACIAALGVVHCRGPRPGKGGRPSGEIIGEVTVEPRRTINDLRVEPGRYEVWLDQDSEMFWLVGGSIYHFPASLRTSSTPVDELTVRLTPVGSTSYLDANVPPDKNWRSYKQRK